MAGGADLSAATTLSDDACAQEPIHRPGAIQPHGLLVGLDAGTMELVTRSANVDLILPGTRPGHLPAWLPPKVIELCRELGRSGGGEKTLLADIAGLGTTEVHCFAASGTVFCELELTSAMPTHPSASDAPLMLAEAIESLV